MNYVGKLFGVFQRLHNRNELMAQVLGSPLFNASFTGTMAGYRPKVFWGNGATFYFTLPNQEFVSKDQEFVSKDQE